MPQNIYALLVGIAGYPPSVPAVPALHAPLNDIQQMETLLQARVADAEARLHLMVLAEEAATRQAIVSAWQEHLGMAGEEDVALFMFSGHGSQRLARTEDGNERPDGETLVCWDSRLPGRTDLADTELSALIAGVSAQCPHLVLILDCCHAGSVHRSGVEETESARFVPPDRRERQEQNGNGTGRIGGIGGIGRIDGRGVQPVRTQSGMAGDAAGANRSVTRRLQPEEAGRYLLLAACQANQKAIEYADPKDGHYSGLFTKALLESLAQASGHITYWQLFQQTQARMLTLTQKQTPRLEATVQDGLHRSFLDDALLTASNGFRVTFDNRHGWVLDAGTLHDIPAEAAGVGLVELYPLASSTHHYKAQDAPLCGALMTTVLPHRTVVVPNSERLLATNRTYRARIVELPLAGMPVLLAGKPEGVELLRHFVSSSLREQTGRLPVVLVADGEKAACMIMAAEDGYQLSMSDQAEPVCRIEGQDAAAAEQILDRLRRVVRWRHLFGLTNAWNATGPSDGVSLELISTTGRVSALSEMSSGSTETGVPDQEIAERVSGQLRLQYIRTGRYLRQPEILVRITNRSPRRYHVALLALGERFAINNFLPGGTMQLDAGKYHDVKIALEVPDELWQMGETTATDTLKLLACRDPFDAYALEQSEIDRFSPRVERQQEDIVRSGTRRSGSTSLAGQQQGLNARLATSWMTDSITITTIRPQR